MSALDSFLDEVGAAVGVPDVAVDPQLRNALLDLTREVAHDVTRVAGPLTMYLIGVAVGRGADPARAIALATEVAGRHAPRDQED